MNELKLTGGTHSAPSEKHWKLVNFCEFDKYAVKSYCAIHHVDENLNLGDITKVNEAELEDFNMMTWGFPCTDISTAGKQKGFIDENGNKTRSGMYYEGIRVLRYKKPALSIIENVKNLVSKKFKSEFEMVLSDLDEAGYNSYYKVLDAKHYGIPQNRERVFIISIRKDLDNGLFNFPEPFDNGIKLKDILEDRVDEKFYLSDDRVQKFLSNFNQPDLPVTTRNSDISSTIRSTYYKNGERNIYENIENGKGYEGIVELNKPVRLGNIYGNQFGPGYAGNVWDKNAICPTLMTMQGGGRQSHMIENPQNSYCIDANYYKGTTPEEYIKKHRRQLIFEDESVKTPQVTGIEKADGCYTNQSSSFVRKPLANLNRTIKANTHDAGVYDGIRIRKLTPRECFRLMGFSDQDFDAAQNAGISATQLYKQAGNSIVVDVLYYIYVELYKAMPYLFDDLKLSSFFSGIGAFETALDRLYLDINSGSFDK